MSDGPSFGFDRDALATCHQANKPINDLNTISMLSEFIRHRSVLDHFTKMKHTNVHETTITANFSPSIQHNPIINNKSYFSKKHPANKSANKWIQGRCMERRQEGQSQ